MTFKKQWNRFWTLNRHHEAGFTLVELIVVIAILAILAGVAVPAYNGYIRKANQAADDQLLGALNNAYAAACATVGESHIGREDVVDIILDDGQLPDSDSYVLANDAEMDSAFRAFFGDGQFKYYEMLNFNKDEGVFKGTEYASNFYKPGVMQGIEKTFNNIANVFYGYDDLTEEAIKAAILGDFGGNLAKALGMEGMLEGYLNATERLDRDGLRAALKQYYPDCNGWTDEQIDAWIDDPSNQNAIKQLKANLGVMHFANSANTEADVKGSVDTIISAVYNGTTVTQDEVWEYYKSTARGQAKIAEVGEDAAKAGDFEDFKGYSYMLGMTGEQLACVNKAIGEDAENEAGINTLGALYAMSAGYFNSDYYEGEQKDFDFGSFVTVTEAMQQPNFMEYYQNQAGADIEAYLEQMRNLSNSEGLDLTQSDMFTGVFTGGSN